MSSFQDHPLRYQLANELHARPFPTVQVPAHAAYLAIKRVGDAVSRNRNHDMEHLIALLDRFGAPHPQPGATHYFGDLGAQRLKWESHTEFVTYTIFADGVEDRPFDARTFEHFPADWLAEAPGTRLTSALIRIEPMPEEDVMAEKLASWFVAESLASSWVLDRNAVVAGDFRIDTGGHMRFGVFAGDGIGPRRVGRITQRLCEIETYKSMSMLGFHRSRGLSAQLSALDQRLEALTAAMSLPNDDPEETLQSLLTISSELESVRAQANFRFSATAAYSAIVEQRVEVLREERLHGRQTFQEFMTRRFDPAMRTVAATEARLASMSERGERAATLLRTRVDVERSAQNQAILESMDRRSDLQLRLQSTVEGLSVVAISYYAVNLASALLAPLGESVGLGKSLLTAVLVPPVVGAVFLMIRRIRRHME